MPYHWEFPEAWETDRERALREPLAGLRAWRDVLRDAVRRELYLCSDECTEVFDACENAPWCGWPERWREWRRDAVGDLAIIGHYAAAQHQSRFRAMVRYELIITLVAEKERAEIEALKLEAAA